MKNAKEIESATNATVQAANTFTFMFVNRTAKTAIATATAAAYTCVRHSTIRINMPFHIHIIPLFLGRASMYAYMQTNTWHSMHTFVSYQLYLYAFILYYFSSRFDITACFFSFLVNFCLYGTHMHPCTFIHTCRHPKASIYIYTFWRLCPCLSHNVSIAWSVQSRVRYK